MGNKFGIKKMGTDEATERRSFKSTKTGQIKREVDGLTNIE